MSPLLLQYDKKNVYQNHCQTILTYLEQSVQFIQDYYSLQEIRKQN